MKNIKDITFKTLVDGFFSGATNQYNSNNQIELIITPDCSKNCGICYLQKHKNELYPKEIVNNDVIINNLKSFLTYLELSNTRISLLSLFSGEIWGDEFGFNVLDTLLDFAKRHQFCYRISIPSNMDFLFVNNGKQKMEYYIKEFAKYGIKIHISASVDGKFLEDKWRPRNGKYDLSLDYDEDYYDTIFKFQSKYRFGLHPMVYSKNCDKWCENFDWFMEMINKFYDIPYEPMMLEVRDNNWTKEDICSYIKFLDHVITWKLDNVFNWNIPGFSQYLANIRSYKRFSNSNIALYVHNDKLDCTIQKTLFIRLGDLTIVPCHRSCYPENIYGYITFNGSTYDVEAKNISLMSDIYKSIPNKDYPVCKDCLYNILCPKGCLGSQYENSGNMFEPCNTVCDMYKAKIDFLINKYSELGVFDCLAKFPETKSYVEIINQFKKDRKQILGY